MRRSKWFPALFLLLLGLLWLMPATPAYALGYHPVQSNIIAYEYPGWKTEKGKKYYLKEDGARATGSFKVDGEYYIFDENGYLQRPREDSLITIGKKIYYVSTEGKALSGWHLIDGKLYSVKKTGVVRRSTTYEGITLKKSGAAKKNTAAKIKIKTMKVVASLVTDKMTKAQKLRACWNYIVSRKRFSYRMRYPNLNEKGWQKTTAYNMLTTKSGNCYSFACAFAAMASELGYKAYVVCGRISGSRDGARDGLTRHAWVMLDGLYYDPELHFAGSVRNIYGKGSYPLRRHQVTKKVEYTKG